MTREQQLKYCKICTKQKFNLEQGIICSLTDKKADFEDTCDWFQEDTSLTNNSYLSEFEPKVNLQFTSKGKRFGNYIVDSLVLLVFNYLAAMALGFIIGIVNPEIYYSGIFDGVIVEYLLNAVFGTIFYTLQEYYTGRTLGKLFTKTKVIMEDGSKPTLKAIAIRSISRFIPFEAFSFLNGNDNSGLHDVFSGTKVVEI